MSDIINTERNAPREEKGNGRKEWKKRSGGGKKLRACRAPVLPARAWLRQAGEESVICGSPLRNSATAGCVSN